MQPVVNRLEAEFGGRVAFLALDARGSGQAVFQKLRLPGHPAVVIFIHDGTEILRAFGIVAESDLRQAVESALGNENPGL